MDTEILARARAGIETHRKADGTIVVRDARGRRVRGATVRLEQVRHEFLFGCNFFMWGRCGTPALEEQYRRRFVALLNYATLGFYWAAYERVRGRPNYDYTDRVVAWCQQQGVTCKGHPLVWDHPAGSPEWLPDDPAEMDRLSRSRVREIVSRFKGRIDLWDVVNEATHLPGNPNQTKMGRWGESLGPVEYVTRHLKVAREANPNARLLVNDYHTGPAYYRILERLRENGQWWFDAIGIQSHMHDGLWPLHRVWDVCETYGQLGLPLHATETTIVSGPRLGPGENWGSTTPEGEQKQAEQVAQFYTVVFGHPAVHAVTWWDFSDRGAWQRAPAGWLRADMSPKPVYDRLMGLIRGDWWTQTGGPTNGRGEFVTRAFYGTHRLSVRLPNGREHAQEIHWRRGQPNRFEVRVS